MPRLNKTRYALLGLLSIRPASGYDMRIEMEASTDHFWKEGNASIYPILKQLLKEKLVSVEVANVETGNPKKVYTLTAAGKKELHQWLTKEPEPLQRRNELLLKVFFGWNAAPAVIISHLKDFHRKTEQALAQYRVLVAAKKTSQCTDRELYELFTLKAGMMYYETNLKWSEDVLRMLTKMSKKRR